MHFIFRLPKSEDGYSEFMLIIVKPSKRAPLILLTSKHKSVDIADIYHGLPQKPISDKYSRFTSEFW